MKSAALINRSAAARSRRRRRCGGRAGMANGCGARSTRFHSTSAKMISSRSTLALARISPLGATMKLWPQNSIPSPPTGASMADAIDRGDEAAVGDGVAALHRFPGGMLGVAVFRFLRRMPADRGRIKKNLGAAQSSLGARLRDTIDPSRRRRRCCRAASARLSKAEVARGEIKLLVIRRVIRDVHLAILPEQLAVGADDRGGVVVKAGGAFLEERGDDDRAGLARDFASAPRSTGRELSRRARSWRGLPTGRNIASGKAPAGR